MHELKAVAVDDSKTILSVIKMYLAKLDIEVVGFLDPFDAIKYVKKNKVDFFFVDYMMPQMNGIEVINEIKPYFDSYIIMITSVGDSKIKLDALRAGVTEFVNKPILEAEFIATITNLGRMRMQQLALDDERILLQWEVSRQIANIKKQESETLDVLAHVAEYRDENTFLHITRVAEYSKILAKYYGFNEKEQEVIYRAAPLHDIGKIGVRDDVLLKQDNLSDEEFELMKQHTVIGYNILKDSSSPILKAGANIALSHHEKWDGTGYPYALMGKKIPLHGRIVAVADVFDALTMERPYKKPWSLAEALTFILDQSEKIFDPEIVDIFLNNSEEIFEFYKHSRQMNDH